MHNYQVYDIKHFFISFYFLSIFSISIPQQVVNEYFPLQIGNRWDYHIYRIWHGTTTEDTLSVTIIDTITIKSRTYFVFSSYTPLGYMSKYFRVQENDIYYLNEQDSSDCFAYRFDVPIDSSYLNCYGFEITILDTDTLFLWGKNDIHQRHNDYIFSKNFGLFHNWVWNIVDIIYDLYGCIISGTTYGNLLVPVEQNALPQLNYSLEQNYPNPFNPSTTIKYSIPIQLHVKLNVYNLLGKEIATLVNEERPAGEYEVEFTGSNLSSGIYFYRLQAGSFNDTKKLILIK